MSKLRFTFMKAEEVKALKLANSILDIEPEFYRLSRRYIGIIHAHSELFCANCFGLNLQDTGISPGADAIANVHAIYPLKKCDKVQIKARSHDTMHITFNTDNIDWLALVTYEIKISPVKVRAYLFPVKKLIELSKTFGEEKVIPLRFTSNNPKNPDKKIKEFLRLEWGCMMVMNRKQGNVKGKPEIWEERYERFDKILQEGYEFKEGKFIQGINR